MTSAGLGRPVDFNADIRPILNQNCTACHGGVKAAGDISFVYRDAATKVGKKSKRPVIVAGKPGESELIARITSNDTEYRMPPADHGAPLPPEKITLLRDWIQQGAPWEDHWAFVPPKPQSMPGVPAEWKHHVKSNVDRFVLARLRNEGLAPAPEASRPALLRRASLDLIGLPPSPEEIAAFVDDAAPDAFERQVDRLLAAPQFGERWASLWLDLARYADTKGYEKDENRTVWPYRDWLVNALNRNLPYDDFMIEQLAGDLLPNASIDQQIATTFSRLTQVNDEGGTDDEEYRIAAVVDRVATTWQTMNAVTFNCVQCHSHPYDPIRHQEYYSFLSFFNTTLDADLNNEHPTLRVPDDAQSRDEAWRLRREVESLRREVVSAGIAAASDPAQWRSLPIQTASVSPSAEITLQGDLVQTDGTVAMNARYEVAIPVLALSSDPIAALRFEAAPVDPEKAVHTPEHGFIVSQIEIALSTPDGQVVPVEVGRFFPDTDNFTTNTSKALSALPPESRARAAGKGPRDVTLDFFFSANPTLSKPRWIVAALREPIVAPPGSSLRVSIIHALGISSKPAPIRRLRVSASSLREWIALGNSDELDRKSANVASALGKLGKIPGIDLPVMAEQPPQELRETRLFVRGNFLDKAGAPLGPAVPELFPKLPAAQPRNRLTLARWFFQPGQPLTARVAVNRFWEQLFGTGIVSTLEDFGSVGEKPTHPELLDWLALRFERDLRWNMRSLLREIVTSATYRQDSRATSGQLARDPQNRLLARGPRQRLTAEMVRDQALAASGLLSRKAGGPPVMPPQPASVWQTVYNSKQWVESPGEDRHRRAIYTFWKRSAAYPGFLTFDMPARDLCTARRTPTNTPLQALVTLNDVVYQEAADALARRAETDAGADSAIEQRIARAFELVISRQPSAAESVRLRKLYDDSLAVSPARALATVTSAIINLDAAFVR